jgi:hypothetical protein
MVAQQLLAFPKQASSEARNIILQVIKSHGAPISTRDLFEKAVKVPAPPEANGEPLTPWAKFLRGQTPQPPYPEHPVRSIRFVVVLVIPSWDPLTMCNVNTGSYLKRTILADLVRTRDVKKIHIKRVLTPEEIERRKATMTKAQLRKLSAESLSQPLSTWAWQLEDKTTSLSKGGDNDNDAGKDDVFGVEAGVGVGEDWDHLNKRRRRTREEQVQRDVEWVKRLWRARGTAGFSRAQ